LESAAELAHECERRAQSVAVIYLQEQVRFVLGQTYYWSGQLESAREQLDESVQMFDEEFRRSRAMPAVQDPAVGSRSVRAMVLWLQGDRVAAFASADEAFALAERLGHPFSSAFALGFAALLYQLEGDVERTADLARRGVAVSAEQGFSFYLALCIVLEGWTIYEQGDRERGLARMEEGIDAYKECGANLGLHYLLVLVGLAKLGIGDVERGREIIETAECEMLVAGGRYYHAEVYRLKAAAAEQYGFDDWDAEALLRKSIAVAREQGAHAIRLRAALQLAQRYSKSGRKDEGKQQLVAALKPFEHTPNGSRHLEDARQLAGTIPD
jgi:tetratricopeptide (TPR) repeat protein